jgi:hypothetical protein
MAVALKRRAISALSCCGIGTMLLLAGCAEPEPLEPSAVQPLEAHGIKPPPGVALTDQECLVGAWRVSDEPLQEYVLSFEPGAELEISGQLTLGFTLERYAVEPRVGIIWQDRGEESLGSLVGQIEGAYELADRLLEVTEERDDIELVDVDNGERSRVPELFLHPVTANPLVGASVTCSGDTLTLTTSPGGSSLQVAFARLR